MKNKIIVLLMCLVGSVYAANESDEQKWQGMDNLGGRHIRPKVVSTSRLNLYPTSRLYFGGCYITENYANRLDIYVGNSSRFVVTNDSCTVNSCNLALDPTKKFYLGTNSYLYEASAGNIYVMANGNHRMSFTPNKTVLMDKMTPANTAAANLGDEVYMFNEVHCVQVVDYSRKNPKDNPLNAIRKIKHEDKTTYPSDVYIPAKTAETDCEVKGKRFKKGEKIGKDGTKILQMIPYLVDAIKELDERINELEKENSKLKKLTGGTNGATK